MRPYLMERCDGAEIVNGIKYRLALVERSAGDAALTRYAGSGLKPIAAAEVV